jgi:hypothetical protein
MPPVVAVVAMPPNRKVGRDVVPLNLVRLDRDFSSDAQRGLKKKVGRCGEDGRVHVSSFRRKVAGCLHLHRPRLFCGQGMELAVLTHSKDPSI